MKAKRHVKVAATLVMALVLIALPLLAACTKEVVKEVPVERVVEKEVIKEVPVERVVEKQVIKEVPVEKVVVKEVAPAPELPKVIRFGSSPAGQLGYVWATATGKVLSTHTTMEVKIEPYASTSVFRDIIDSGELQLGYNSKPDLYEAYRGSGSFNPVPRIRAVVAGPALKGGLLVRAQSGMKDVKDVKGKRVGGDYKAHYATYLLTYGSLASAGLAESDVRIVPLTTAKTGVAAFQEGRIDVATHVLDAADVEEANSAIPGGIRWLNLDASPEGIAGLNKVVRGGEIWEVTSGTGILAPTNMISWRMDLITNKDVSDEVIYQVAKTMWEHIEDLYPFHRTMEEVTRDTLVAPEVAVIPYHPGAIRLYKEKGVWTSKNDAIQAKLLKDGGQ